MNKSKIVLRQRRGRKPIEVDFEFWGLFEPKRFKRVFRETIDSLHLHPKWRIYLYLKLVTVDNSDLQYCAYCHFPDIHFSSWAINTMDDQTLTALCLHELSHFYLESEGKGDLDSEENTNRRAKVWNANLESLEEWENAHLLPEIELAIPS